MARIKVTVSNLETQDIWSKFFEQENGEWLDDDGDVVADDNNMTPKGTSDFSNFLAGEIRLAKEFFDKKKRSGM